MTIGVVGAGAFGTSLAISIARSGAPVVLWARDEATVKSIQETRTNAARLPNIQIPENVVATSDLSDLTDDVVLLSVPMQRLREVLNNAPSLQGKTLVACCKGIELTTGLGPVAVISDCMPSATPAILTGPSFASDIAKGLPTALTLACSDAQAGLALQQQLRAPNLRIYRTTDTIGAELGGALKNVIAIACGASDGAGLGDSARASVMTRGFAEINRMALKLGALPDTLAGLSGFGDLTLTCTSDQSRNYQFGHALGREVPFDVAITVEGAATARATLEKARKLNIEMPITESVVALLDQKLKVREAMTQLLARPAKEE
ncbi:NAD(P)H-dependent glycerol-3-phosphate dehydrogenase [Cognatishimia sp. WU-CL00825]|uniref:NAD(P)H-dependent glycerol-3-phosphate dehydrogenase n=1 Tax=Cognatishimia sp. WU-CL00825 TaxID=3127658 RepID=UPI003107EAD6